MNAARAGQLGSLGRLKAHAALIEGPEGRSHWIFDALLGCLHQTALEIDRAESALGPHFLSLRTAGERMLSRSATSGFLRQLRLAQERDLQLLDFAGIMTADFRPTPDTSTLKKDFYVTLGAWCAQERRCIQLERTALVACLLRLDREVGDGHAVDLRTHRHLVLSQDGSRSEATVFCPAERHSVGPDWCRDCPFVRDVSSDRVRCAPADVDHRDSSQVDRIGDDVFVGSAMAREHVSVSPDTVAGALAGLSVRAVTLVDEGGHLLGLVHRDDLVSAPVARRAGEIVRASEGIQESATVADAVERMARTHRRFLPVLDSHGRVVGMISDLDLLRTAARREVPTGR